VPFGEFVGTLAIVVERIEDVMAAEEGHVWLRAYYTGSEHHAAQVRIEGTFSQEAEQEPWQDDASLASAVVRTNGMLIGMVTEKERVLERYHQHQLQAVQTVTHLALREGLADLAARQEAIRASVQEFGPIIAALAPALVAHFTGGSASEAPPSSPREAVDRAVQTIGRQVAALSAVLAQGVPEGAEPSIMSLRDLVQRIGPALGLVVTEAGEQAAA
jgi:hypothetical protein